MKSTVSNVINEKERFTFPILLQWDRDGSPLVCLFTENKNCIVMVPDRDFTYVVGQVLEECSNANSGNWKRFIGNVTLSN